MVYNVLEKSTGKVHQFTDVVDFVYFINRNMCSYELKVVVTS